jgi:hypothetical protein
MVTVEDTARLLKTESGEMSYRVAINQADNLAVLIISGESSDIYAYNIYQKIYLPSRRCGSSGPQLMASAAAAASGCWRTKRTPPKVAASPFVQAAGFGTRVVWQLKHPQFGSMASQFHTGNGAPACKVVRDSCGLSCLLE